MHTKTIARLSRRALLGGGAAGFGLISGLVPLRAETPATTDPRAIAFDGAGLLLAAGGLRHSADGGVTWSALADRGPGAIAALAAHPDRPGRVHAALAAGGVARSSDGGRSWAPQGAGLPATPAAAITVAAAAPDTLYLAVRGDGLWQSTDAGGSWSFAMDRPYLAVAEREVLALASVNDASGMGGIWVYAGTDLGLTRVPDCFCRWQDVQPGDAMEALASGKTPPPAAPLPAGESVRALALAPQAPETLYAGLASGIWKSGDAGVNWKKATKADVLALAVNPADPNHIVAATRGGIILSRNGGTTWTAAAAF